MGLVLQGVYSIPELRSQIKQSYVYESRDNCSYLKYTLLPTSFLIAPFINVIPVPWIPHSLII